MEERITINPKMKGFSSVFGAVEFVAKPYERILNTIPVGEWVRCKDIAKDRFSVASVAKLFTMLCNYRGYAEKRVVDDGIIEIEDERYEYNFEHSIPREIRAYDENGLFIGMVENPAYKIACKNRAYSNGKWVKYKRPIHAHHTEYRLLP